MSRQIRSVSRTDWQTPPEFFTALSAGIGGFKCDVAANAENTLVPKCWFGPGSPHGQDALEEGLEWPSPAFCNPPYLGGDAWRAWLLRFNAHAGRGGVLVTVIPAATGAKWWRDLIVEPGMADILFVTGRIKFNLP